MANDDTKLEHITTLVEKFVDEQGAMRKELTKFGEEQGLMRKELTKLGEEQDLTRKELTKFGQEQGVMRKELTGFGDEQKSMRAEQKSMREELNKFGILMADDLASLLEISEATHQELTKKANQADLGEVKADVKTIQHAVKATNHDLAKTGRIAGRFTPKFKSL